MKSWVNSNQHKGEITDEEFESKISEKAKTRDIKVYGRDGHFQVYQEQFTYRGIKYWIRILRYYQIGVPIKEIHGMNHIGKWAVLERDEQFKELCDFIESHQEVLGRYDFLWADTLHIHNEKQTLKQMFESMRKQGEEDVDWLLDEAETAIDLHIQEYSKKAKAVREIISKNKERVLK